MQPYTPSSDESPAAASPIGVFDRLLVGIDSTDESLVAAAQARVLLAPGGQLVLLAAVERHHAAHAGLFAPTAADHLRSETSTELERASELVDADDAVLAPGSLVPALLAEAARRDATLIAIGARPHRRLAAATFGGHDVEALHDVDRSLLIARPGWGPAHPSRVVVGVDGSPAARAAEAIARGLARRLGCEIAPIVALGEDDVDLALLRAEREDALLHPGTLQDAVVSACSNRSLLVVGHARDGSRRRRDATAERIVHAARCSVLVVDGETVR